MERTRKISLAVSGMIALLALAAAPAWAVEEHLYDPVLSLTGGTAVSAEDEVPDPPGTDPAKPHPPKPFDLPCGTTTDSHGDIYVSSIAPANGGSGGSDARIDIFDPQGRFLLEIPNSFQPCSIAVDSVGNLYAVEGATHDNGELFKPQYVDRYEPDSFPPTSATDYSLVKSLEFTKINGSDQCKPVSTVNVDPSNDHLYLGHGCRIEEFGSAAEGSPLIDKEVIGDGDVQGGVSVGGFDVYGANHDIYAIERRSQDAEYKAVVLDGVDGHVKCEVGGVETSEGEFEKFEFTFAKIAVAVDQANGDFYLYDGENGVDYQFTADGEECRFVGRLPMNPPTLGSFGIGTEIAVDDPIEVGESGYDSPNEGYVYATSGKSAKTYHLYAFKPRIGGPPEVRDQSLGGIAETEAVLEAKVNPSGFATKYHFEYITQAAFQKHGYEGATRIPVADARAGAGGAFIPVYEPVTGLAAGVAYRFRLVASNCEAEGSIPGKCLTQGEGDPGAEGEDESFATYPSPPVSPLCLNAALRTGPSATLPDCRAYELVTPPDTNGRIPTMAMLGEGFGGVAFDTPLASPDGESVVFGSNGGSLPGVGGGGYQDTYDARRGSLGWQSGFTGLDTAQAAKLHPGGISSDHLYGFWNVEGEHGTLAVPGSEGNYLRVPAGSPEPSSNCAPAAESEGGVEWIGCGSLGFDSRARGKWISPGGEHVIFATETNNGATAKQLEPCGPPTGKNAIYDRIPGGPTRCVSLLPGDITPADGADYLGATPDGRAIVFAAAGIFVRLDNTRTIQISGNGSVFGGISADGDRAFYLEGGNVFACDLGSAGCAGEEAHQPIPVGSGGGSTLVNVSADGSHAYFISKAALTGGEENEAGAKAKAGAENLYVWDGSNVSFVALLDPIDVSGEGGIGGLGLWVSRVLGPNPGLSGGPADDPSRTTPDGTAIVFESRANLTGYDSGKHREIYRYDAGAEVGRRLACLSCNPTGLAATSDARLESPGPGSPISESLPPVNAVSHIANVSVDGKRVFFQSADRLVAADLDGKVDVYEWEAEGAGNCLREAGCISLISSGKGTEDNYLYAMTPDGHDVFFLGGDTLVPQDPSKTQSIYDARVEGGFPTPSAPAGECLGEACQPAVRAPDDSTPGSSSFEGPGNPGLKSRKRCPDGKRKVRRAGKTLCVKSNSRKRGHRKAHRRNVNRRAAR